MKGSRRAWKWVCAGWVVVFGGFACIALAGGTSRPAGADRYNVIVFLTDDQRFDEIDVMPFVGELFAGKGVVFSNAFVTNPACCPVRASFLDGGFYSHQTGVLTNQPPNGSIWNFHDRHTLGTRLQKAGFNTALIGKYINLYTRAAEQRAENVPPGWTRFYGSGPIPPRSWKVIIGSSGPDAPNRGQIVVQRDYPDDDFSRWALEVLEDFTAEEKPFFMLLAFHAPHTPWITAQRKQDDDTFGRLLAEGRFRYRGRGWGEQPDGDVSDKPLYVRQSARGWWGGDAGRYRARPFMAGYRTPDDLVAARVASLLEVDRTVRRVVELLRRRRRLDRTLLVFTSDNGFMLGEHKLYYKRHAYEESIRVPLLIWHAGVRPHEQPQLVAMDLDLPNTVLDYAGAERFKESPGASLRPLIEGKRVGWRDALIFESFSEANARFIPDWVAVRTDRWKYVEYSTDELELYDLANDPFELKNIAGDAAAEQTRRALAARLDGHRPLMMRIPLSRFPGGARRPLVLPPARVSVAYSVQLEARGGQPPYRWDVVAGPGALPPGITLDVQTGRLAGTPTRTGRFLFNIRVQDASRSPVHGGPQRYIRLFGLVVRR